MSDFKRLRQNKIPLKCEICEKEFKNSSGLKTHFNITHDLKKKEYQCNICQKVFNFQEGLTRHMKMLHENKKHHKCDSCGKSFFLYGN